MSRPVSPLSQYAVPIPKLDGKVIFYIIPKTPYIDMRAYRMAEAMKASSVYQEATEAERPALDLWLDALPILLLCTTRIEFGYGPDEEIAQPVQMFKDWWEVVELEASVVTIFEKRCELVTDLMENIWQSAWQAASMPFAKGKSKPGDTLTKEEREALSDANSPLAKKGGPSVRKSGSGRRSSGKPQR